MIQELGDQGRERPPQPSTSQDCSDFPLFPALQWGKRRLKTTFCTPNCRAKSQSLCSGLLAEPSIPLGPLGPWAPHVAPVAPLARDRAGECRGKPLGVCVRVCLCVCARAVLLRAEPGRPRLGVDFLWMTFPDCLKQ